MEGPEKMFMGNKIWYSFDKKKDIKIVRGMEEGRQEHRMGGYQHTFCC